MWKITAGVYYALTGLRVSDWSIMTVISPDLHFRHNLQAPFAQLVPQMRSFPGWRDFVSGHPSVYRCRYVLDDHRARHFAFEHTFYDGFRVWVAAGPEDALWLK